MRNKCRIFPLEVLVYLIFLDIYKFVYFPKVCGERKKERSVSKEMQIVVAFLNKKKDWLL